MAYVAVDIFVKDTSPMQDPVSGVVVRAFNDAGLIALTQGVTDNNGHVGFLLPDSQTYQLRFYKRTVQFTNPQYIAVLPAPGKNIFDVAAQIFTPPVAVDPRLCRTSGFFRGVTGAPAAGQDIHIIAKFDPLILEGAALTTERVHFRTDRAGYAEIDLIRFAQYDVTLEGMEDMNRIISIPDAPSVNLPDLLFPRVRRVSFDPPPSSGYLLAAGGSDYAITPTVMMSDGRLLDGTATGDVQWSSSDTSILSVTVNQTTVTLRGISRGHAQLLITPQDSSIVVIPNLPVSGSPVNVTVA